MAIQPPSLKVWNPVLARVALFALRQRQWSKANKVPLRSNRLYMIHVRDSVLYASALTQCNRKQVFLPESCIVSSSCVTIDITTAATAAAAAAVRHKYKDSHSHVPI
jgi:hypothetical protein